MLRNSRARRQGASPGLVHQAPANQPAQAAGHPLVGLALAAGQHALRCAGKGWYPESDVVANAHAGQTLLLELIGFRRIEIKINHDVLLQRAAALQSVALTDPAAIVVTAVRSLVRLYAGHYSTCPLDSWRHQQLVDAASWGAYGTYYPTESERQLAVSIAAFYERAIVAETLTRMEGADFVSGLAMERKLNQHPPHFLWTLFQRSQAALFPAAWEPSLRICSCEPDPVVDALLSDVLFILFRTRVRTVGGRLKLRGKIRRPPAWAWSEAVEALAELLIPYLESSSDSGPPQPNPFLRSARRGDRSQSGPPGLDPSDLSNPFLRPRDHHHQGSLLPYAGAGLLPGAEQGRGLGYSFELLDEYYSRTAQSLQVKDGSQDRPEEEPEMLPVGFLDHAPATLRDLASSHIDWFRTRRAVPSEENPSGLKLFRLTEPLEIPAHAFDPGYRNVPNLLLVVDSSGSMGFNPQGTSPARGKYDLVLLASWGIMRYIAERGLVEQVWVGAVNFSGATRSSGWHRAGAIEPVKRVLAAYEGGGTTLGTGAIRMAQETAPGRFVLVAMTDGNVGNTPTALEELRQTIAAGHSLVLLHIGAPNAFTDGVRRLGGTVQILNHAQELVGLCLDLAKANYGDPNR